MNSSKGEKLKTWFPVLVTLMFIFLLICYHAISNDYSIRHILHLDVKPSPRHNLHLDVKPGIIHGKEIYWKENMTRIPKIIHQTYKTEDLSNLLRPWMRSWLEKNPEWQHWYWTDADIRNFITARYPDYLSLFDAYKIHIQRSDVFRYFVLYEFGGLYADVDVQCLQSLDSRMAEQDCLLTQESPIHALFTYNASRIIANSILASRPRHPFMIYLIEQLQFYRLRDVLWATGPMFVDMVYDTFVSLPENKNYFPHLALVDEFHPKIDYSQISSFKHFCKSNRLEKYHEVKTKVCEEIMSGNFTNGPKKNSIAIHHWTHMWTTFHSKYGSDHADKTFNAKKLFESTVGVAG